MTRVCIPRVPVSIMLRNRMEYRMCLVVHRIMAFDLEVIHIGVLEVGVSLQVLEANST